MAVHSSYPWDKARFIFVLGGPGAGKGTQCAKLAVEFGVAHLSVSDLLRNQKREPNLSLLLQDTMSKGGIMPCEMVMQILYDKMVECFELSDQHVFLINGFPRTFKQLVAFENKFGGPTCTLYFQCAEDIMLRRVLNRQKLAGRIDDNEDTFHKRLNGYNSETIAVIEKLRQTSYFIEIDCNGDLDDGYELVKKAFIQGQA